MLINKEILIQLADLIAAQFGSDTEVVVHDFSGDLDHTIVHIVNGHVTGREVGGCPTKMFLKYVSLEGTARAKLRYITHTTDGRIIRSSTANFFDENGTLNGGLCINQDISNLVALEKSVKGMTDSKYFETTLVSSDSDDIEIYPKSIQGLMDGIISEGLAAIGTPPDKMNKEAKINLLKFLDERGVFLIQKSGQRVCDLLGISKFTLYNYLEEARCKDEKK